MVHYRTQTRIVADVLRAARDSNTAGDGVGISTLIRKGNMSYSRTIKLVGELVGAGLLVEVVEKEDEVRLAPSRYRISKKGVEFLHTYAQFDEFAQMFGLQL